MASQAHKTVTHSLPVGVISDQLRSKEVAVGEVTGEPRVVFVENAGLAIAVPVE